MSAPPFQIQSLDHVVLRCARLDETIAFYRDVLGCPIERVAESISLHQLRAGTSLIDLVPVGSELGGDTPPERDAFNLQHFCLRIARADWDAVARHLAAHGIETDAPARRYGAEGFGRSIYLSDPEGNTVELKGPPEAARAD